MKKRMIISALVLGAGLVQAAVQNNVWTGNAGDNDFNNDTNWWNSIAADDLAFFRGDDVADFPARTNADLSADITISGLKFQGSILADAAYNITGSGGTLTLDGDPEGQATLVEVFNAVTVNQTIAADLVLDTINNANNQHIKTGSGAGLILSGTVSQGAGSSGLGIFVGNGDIEISGNVDGSGMLWKIRDNAGGTGVLKLTGSGVWSGFGTVQIDNNAEVLLSRSTTDSSAFRPGVLQILDGGTLSLGNDEQIYDQLPVNLGSGVFNLDGNTETVFGFKFLAVDDSASLDMGVGGVLNLGGQDSAAVWGDLTIYNWNSGEDHIYVTGGSFSAAQLAAITFDKWEPAGAKVEGGELLPTGSNIELSAYENWAADFGVGIETGDDDNDGLINVHEYGLGGDPTNATDQGISPISAVDGGVLTYIYPQLSDPASGLDYHLELTDNLVVPAWADSGYTVTGTNVVVGDFDYVTNSISVDIDQKFIRLMIDTL